MSIGSDEYHQPRGSWTAIHCYLPRSEQTNYLVNRVRPIVDRGQFGRFFFLRYWKGGPHLRLRFGGLSSQAADAVHRRLQDGMFSFSEDLQLEYATEASYQAKLAALENEPIEPIRRIGTVELQPYIPEFGKYGGKQGIELAEDLFSRTSQQVLQVLTSVQSHEPVGQAIEVMVSALRGVGLNLDECLVFLDGYIKWWVPYVPEPVLASWDRIGSEMRISLRAFTAGVWHNCEGSPFWQIYDHVFRKARSQWLAQSSEHTMPNELTSAQEITLAGVPFLHCFGHYLHTTNNRLGLSPASEALAGYLLYTALSDIKIHETLKEDR